MQELYFIAYLQYALEKEMFVKNILFNIKSNLSKIFSNHKGKLPDNCENITSIPGIGTKNCNNFYKAGYMTPESIISASDEELLTIPGVGISFIKKLRKTLDKV